MRVSGRCMKCLGHSEASTKTNLYKLLVFECLVTVHKGGGCLLPSSWAEVPSTLYSSYPLHPHPPPPSKQGQEAQRPALRGPQRTLRPQPVLRPHTEVWREAGAPRTRVFSSGPSAQGEAPQSPFPMRGLCLCALFSSLHVPGSTGVHPTVGSAQ